jgi:tyrosinase
MDEPIFDADLNRRVFVRGLGFVSLGFLLGTFGGCEQLAEAIRNRPVRRRLRTGSAAVDTDIATYKQAVTLMKSLPASDPRSWTAQATIHGTVAGGFNFCQHGTDHFFDWHRAYLLYFEQICQKLTGNARFGLPYWNWNQNLDIHPAFLDSAGPLFLARNRTSMSGSWAVTTAALDPILADSNFFTFGQQIEGTPHNTVHSYIGGTMGSGGSALDPLFWMHHCMVDYGWAKWNLELGNNNTNDASWINTPNEHFVDADGNVASVMAGLTTIMPLFSYRYESSAIGSSPATPAITTKAEFQRLEKRIREGAPIRFDVQRRFRVADKAVISIARPTSMVAKLTPSELAGIIDSDAAKERVFATVAFAKLPPASDFAVRVFVNLPGASRDTSLEDPHFAGSFAFFGAEPEGGEGRGHAHHPTFLVNVTNTLRKLKRAGQLKADDPISVKLVAVPFAETFQREDTELLLEGIDLIVTPVILNVPTR